MKEYPNIFTPLKVGAITFKNRIFTPPNLIGNLTPDDYPTDYMISYYEAKAKGGAAMVTVGNTCVDQESAPDHDMLRLDRKGLPYFIEMATAIKRHGAVASIEMNHSGQIITRRGYPPIGPTGFVRKDGVEVIEMDESMIQKVVDHFGDTAALAKTAGFEMCLVHGGHGWLIHQFLSPYYNKRTDRFGGSLENRARFALMVVDSVRKAVGPDFLIEFRMSGDDLLEGGFHLEDSIPFAKMLDDNVDLLHVSAGVDLDPDLHIITHPLTFLPHGSNTYLAAAIKKEVKKTPVVAIGGISSPEFAEKLIAERTCDAVAICRAIIADQQFVNKARMGRREDIRPCLRCLNCLRDLQDKLSSGCAVNPTAGREFRLLLEPSKTEVVKKVLIAGGGPGGMQAAITAAERGHKVILAEKTDSLGGILKYTDYDILKEDLGRFKNYLVKQVTKNPNIELRLNTEVTADYVKHEAPDALIVAVGSEPIIPNIPGVNLPNVKQAIDMYSSLDSAGEKVVIIGGGLVGCELGTSLGKKGRNIEVIEMMDKLDCEYDWRYWNSLFVEMKKYKVTCKTGFTCTEILPNGIKVIDQNGNEQFIEANTVVLATGMAAKTDIVERLRGLAYDFRPIGDCVKARQVTDAIHEGFFAGRSLTEVEF